MIDKVWNLRRFGKIILAVITSALGICLDNAWGNAVLALLAVGHIVHFFTLPRAFLFDREKLTVKYYFGYTRSIRWTQLRDVEREHETRALLAANYVFYVSGEVEGKSSSLFDFQMNANKKTKKLLRKYWNPQFDK